MKRITYNKNIIFFGIFFYYQWKSFWLSLRHLIKLSFIMTREIFNSCKTLWIYKNFLGSEFIFRFNSLNKPSTSVHLLLIVACFTYIKCCYEPLNDEWHYTPLQYINILTKFIAIQVIQKKKNTDRKNPKTSTRTLNTHVHNVNIWILTHNYSTLHQQI